MKYLDLDNWNRKDHYYFFKEMDYPHFNICGNIDITEFYHYLKENEQPFFLSTLYAITKAANCVKELRYRIRDDKVIEHEVINPAITIMGEENVFGFCTVDFIDDFEAFKLSTGKEIERAKKNVTLEDDPNRDDLIYMTSIPWISFTNLTHPIHMNPVDSVPRIAWGKYFEENNKIKLPLSIQAHHALVDGVHAGQYFTTVQEMMDKPAKYI